MVNLRAQERLDNLSKSAAVVAVGTCAQFGGIPSGKPNPTGAMGVLDYLGPDWRSALNLPVICVPGCPVHGEHLAETLTSAVLAVRGYLPVPDLDDYHRSKFVYGTTVTTCAPWGDTTATRRTPRNTRNPTAWSSWAARAQ